MIDDPYFVAPELALLATEEDPPLLAAWIESGGTKASFRARAPLSLDDYERSKLQAAGVDMKKLERFFRKTKALLGSRLFAATAGEVSERENSRGNRGSEYGGAKIGNVTGAVVGLFLSRVSTLGGAAQVPATTLRAEVMQAKTDVPAVTEIKLPEVKVVTPPPETRSSLRVRKKIAQSDAVQAMGAEPELGSRLWCSANLVQISLPHKDPGMEVDVWSRANGNKRLIVTAGREGEGTNMGLPYGVKPRLLLQYIQGKVTLTGDREIELGRTACDLLRELGSSVSKQNYDSLIKMGRRLFAASIITEVVHKSAHSKRVCEHRVQMPIADESILWWGGHPADAQNELFTSKVILNERFFNELRLSAFPVHRDAIRAIQASSLMIDIYCWLCWRNFQLHRSSTTSVTIPFGNTEQSLGLAEQFGSEYGRVRDFRTQFAKHMRTIEPVWHGKLDYTLTSAGMVLRLSTPQISGTSEPFNPVLA